MIYRTLVITTFYHFITFGGYATRDYYDQPFYFIINIKHNQLYKKIVYLLEFSLNGCLFLEHSNDLNHTSTSFVMGLKACE